MSDHWLPPPGACQDLLQFSILSIVLLFVSPSSLQYYFLLFVNKATVTFFPPIADMETILFLYQFKNDVNCHILN